MYILIFFTTGFETFLILKIIQWDIATNVEISSCKISVILVGFQRNFKLLDRFFEKPQVSNFIKILPVGAETFYADEYKERHNEATSRFSQLCERA